MLNVLDCIVIGAGPAGLAAGTVLKNSSKQYLILEQGKDVSLRDSNNPKDISTGIGGGGLFSDGKLSFPPSATNLWLLLQHADLKNAYHYLAELLGHCGINIPSFSDEWTKSTNYISNHKSKKTYNSIVLNNYMRTKLLGLFCQLNQEQIVHDCKVSKIKKIKSFYAITTSNNMEYFCHKIIIATGKYGYGIIEDSLIATEMGAASKIELGIRVEVPSKSFQPYFSEAPDYKIIETIDEGAEFRTFCCCKDGIVLKSEFEKYISFNGANSQFKTQNSNIGLLIRTVSSTSEYYHEMKSLLEKDIAEFRVSGVEFLNSDRVFIGEKCDNLLKQKLLNVVLDNTEELKGTTIYGPEVEYIGKYIKFDSGLSIDEGIWIAGDVSGQFRGLIAALISGIYCANQYVQQASQQIDRSINSLGINISDSSDMPLIFTAQSKKFFYCKDVICQYVLEREHLPVNPFQVFDYFLNDRVDRDIVRRGNNQLIKSCKELWVFGPIADGVLFEIALAKKLGKSIRFFTIGTRVNELSEIVDLSNIVFEPEVHSKKIKKEDLMKFISDSNFDDGQLDLSMFW